MKIIHKTAFALAGSALLASAGAAQAAPAADGAEAKAATGQYKILKNLKYRGPGDAPLRQGYYKNGKGFGWTKINKKHAITKYGAVEFITKGPNRKHQGGKSYRQWAYAGKYKCRNGVCKLVKQYKVLAVVNEDIRHSGRDHKPKGVITAYCEGIVRCPAWVTITLNKQNQGIRAADTPNGESLLSGYKELSKSYTVKAKTAAVPTEKYQAAHKPLASPAAIR